MKPVSSVGVSRGVEALATSEMDSNESETDVTHNSLLDALRNTYISEKSGLVFRKTTTSLANNHFPKVSAERQSVVDEFVQKFSKLTNEEQLLFYLRLPHSPNTTPNVNLESRLGILASRVEIRRTAAWIRSHLQIDHESSIPKRDVYDKYIEYCQCSRMIPISIADFGKVMKQLYPSVRPRRLGTRGQSQYCYSGMNSCQDLHRPSLYVETSQKDAEQVQNQDQCGQIFPVAECQTKQFEFYNQHKESKTKSQDCSYERKCRNRKTALCHRTRWRRPFCRKDHSAEHPPEGPVEDEIAQYFETTDHMFCRPLKIVKGNTSRVPSSIYRSLSYSGGNTETSTPQSRCQSSVSTHGSPWSTYETSSTFHHSSNSLTENQLCHEKNELRSESCVSRNSRSSLTHHCGFTPISPSPIPWRPYSAAHTYTDETISPFRPRSFSSADGKWAVPLVIAKQEVVMDPEPILLAQESINQKSNDSNRSQSLPSFKEGNTLIPQLSTNYVNEFGIMDMTNVELSDMLDNSMVVENMCDVKIEEDLLPQLDNILESMKHPNDIMNTDSYKDSFQMLPQDDISDLAVSEESLRENFDNFF